MALLSAALNELLKFEQRPLAVDVLTFPREPPFASTNIFDAERKLKLAFLSRFVFMLRLTATSLR